MNSRYAFYSNLILFLLLTFSMLACNGSEYRRDRKAKRVVLAANEVHEGWYFAAGDEVVIEGTINGDAYVAGGIVEVEGTINGDLLVAGGMVTVGGTVSDDIRAAGGTVRFNGKVGKNISVAGGTVLVAKSGNIGGNLLAACGNLEVTGTIEHEAKVASGDAGISGTIKGNVDFAGDYLSVPQGANIGGNVNARVREKENVTIADGSVHGKVDVSLEELRHATRILGYSAWHFWLKFVWACSVVLVGLIAVFLFPTQIKKIGSTITQRLGETSIWGILGIIVIPIVSVVLCVTIIGIPVGVLALTIFLWMLYFSQLSLGVVLADRLFVLEGKTRWNLFGAIAAGVVIMQALTFIPYLRFLVNIATVILGMGAILLVVREETLRLRAK